MRGGGHVQGATCYVLRAVPGAPCLVLGAMCLVLGAMCLMLGAARPAVAQMPEPRTMHGQAIPSGELAPGSVTVRVIRQALGNNVPGVEVELHGAGDVRRATTAADGRAQFTALPVGASVHAIARVEAERLESVAFEVPATGGVRTILVAGLGLGTAGSPSAALPAPSATPAGPAAPATGGGLSLGNNTRFAIEFQDDTIAVFYLLEIVNSTGAPATLPSPLAITLPVEAVGAALLEGASPLASLSGPRVTVNGPIPIGTTSVPIAFRVESWGARHEFSQVFPLSLDQVAIGVQRLAGLSVEAPQSSSIREASLSGQAFFIANGPALAAGSPLRVILNGLPHKSPVPLYTALALGVVIAGVGVWLALTRERNPDDGRRRLEVRRARGLAALAALDADHRAGRVQHPAYEDRRARLLAELERVYGALDQSGVPPGGGQGLAA